MEIWKDIKGYEGYYQVSNLGRIKSLKRIVSTVSWFSRDKKWQAGIYINGFSKNLGRFNNEYEAHIAYENELNSIN